MLSLPPSHDGLFYMGAAASRLWEKVTRRPLASYEYAVLSLGEHVDGLAGAQATSGGPAVLILRPAAPNDINVIRFHRERSHRGMRATAYGHRRALLQHGVGSGTYPAEIAPTEDALWVRLMS